MTKQYRITGDHAIRLAERDSLTIHCYANPIDDGGIVSLSKAREIAREDAGLLYIVVVPAGWTGDATGYHVCDYFRMRGEVEEGHEYNGPDEDGIEPIWADAPEVVT